MKKLWLLILFFASATNGVAVEPIVLATGEWTPYTSEKMDGNGFVTEIVTEVFKEMKTPMKLEFYPWRRCYEYVKKGKVWGAFPYSYTEERAGEVFFSNKVGESKTVFFYYKNNKSYKFETLEDLKFYRLGGIAGYFYEEAFRKAGLRPDYAANELSAYNKLMAGRSDLLPLNEMVGRHIIRQNFPDKSDSFGILEKPYSTNDLLVIASRHYPNSSGLLEKFNAALKKVKTGSAYQAILVKHGIDQ